jgi:hypothetical protein
MEKVVPFFKSFMTTFYLKIFELGKVSFWIVQSLKEFEYNLNPFEIESNFAVPPGTVDEAPHVGDSRSPILHCSIAQP